MTGGGPNGAALGPDGAIYVCNSGAIDRELGCHLDDGPDAVGRIERIDPATGKVDRLYERCGDITLGAPNDLVFDKRGRDVVHGFWKNPAAILGKERPLSTVDRTAPPSDVGFSAAVNGRGFGAVSYNGVGLSPDGRTVYVADTRTTRVIGFDLAGPGRARARDGSARRPRPGVATVPGDLGLDSLAVSAAGKLCIGTLWTGGIAVVDPVDGRVEHIAFPDELVTNIAFGGEDMRTAYITLSGSGKFDPCALARAGLEAQLLERMQSLRCRASLQRTAEGGWAMNDAYDVVVAGSGGAGLLGRPARNGSGPSRHRCRKIPPLRRNVGGLGRRPVDSESWFGRAH